MQIITKIDGSITADSKLVKQEVNGTVILPPLVFPVLKFIGDEKSFMTLFPPGVNVIKLFSFIADNEA